MPASEKLKSTVAEFLSLKQKGLRARLQGGFAIDPAGLDNFEYKGISLGLPGFIDKLAWKTFTKTFHRDPQTGNLRGWNVRMEQTGIFGPRVYRQKKDALMAWGHYRVVSNAGRKGPIEVPQGLLLDYGQGGNSPWDITVDSMRDPLVALEKDSVDVLLGWSYMQFGGLQVSTPSYFLLVRECPLTHRANPPLAPKIA